jgi:hypothetical protein
MSADFFKFVLHSACAGGGMSRVVCFRNLCPLETVLSVREFLKDQVYDTVSDSVDLAPSWEFYPVTRGEWQAGTPCRSVR